MRLHRRMFLGFSTASILAALGWQVLADNAEDGFQTLFDGKTFEGWEGDLKTFRIEDGVIIGGTMKEKIPRNEFLCTKQEFGDIATAKTQPEQLEIVEKWADWVLKTHPQAAAP